MAYKYCLRWHDVANDNLNHEECCKVPGLQTSRWSMERHHYIRDFVLGIGRSYGHDRATIGSGGRVEDHASKVHLIHPEDWDYISDRGV